MMRSFTGSIFEFAKASSFQLPTRWHRGRTARGTPKIGSCAGVFRFARANVTGERLGTLYWNGVLSPQSHGGALSSNGRRVDVIVLHRQQLAFPGCADADALLGARPVTNRVKHHLAAQHQSDWSANLPCSGSGQRTVHPGEQLVTKPEPTNFAMTRTFSTGKRTFGPGRYGG